MQVNHDASHLGASHSLDVAVFLDRLCEAILGWDRNAWQVSSAPAHSSHFFAPRRSLRARSCSVTVLPPRPTLPAFACLHPPPLCALAQTHHVLLHHSYTGDSTLDPDMRHGINIWCKIGDQCVPKIVHTLLPFTPPPHPPLHPPPCPLASSVPTGTAAWRRLRCNSPPASP